MMIYTVLWKSLEPPVTLISLDEFTKNSKDKTVWQE